MVLGYGGKTDYKKMEVTKGEPKKVLTSQER